MPFSRRTEHEIATLYNNSPIGIAIVGLDYVIESANPAFCKLTGYSESALREKTIFNITHPDDRPKNEDLQGKLKNGAIETFSMEKRFLHPDGKITWGKLYATLIRDEENKPAYFLGQVINITESKIADEEKARLLTQLHQRQKLESIGTLARGVAHEINNPITAILSFAELIQENAVRGEALTDYAGRIIHETNRVATIVQNLLSFARDENQRHSPAAMPDIIETTLSLIRAVLRKDRIELKINIEDFLPPIKCRSQQIQQVLMNLITNARDSLNSKYSPGEKNKILTIHCRKIEKDGKEFIRTSVEDTGNGISEAIHERIFDPFYTTKPRNVGTGLGLSISHGIINDHKGELHFESKEGEYTRFFIDLPVENNMDNAVNGIIMDL